MCAAYDFHLQPLLLENALPIFLLLMGPLEIILTENQNIDSFFLANTHFESKIQFLYELNHEIAMGIVRDIFETA